MTTPRLLVAFFAAMLAFAAPQTLRAQEITAAQRSAIEKIIHEYIVQHPEVLQEAMVELEKRQTAAESEKHKVAVKENAQELFNGRNQVTLGNPKGDVTFVEFFDYNCGYCKRAFSDVAKIVEKDPKVKLVFKELPILSKGSEEAAKVALAARLQGKYWDVHRTLIALRGEVNEQTALRAVEKLGLDMPKLRKDMEAPEVKAEIDTVRDLAQKMGIQGTPHFLVGDKAIPGAPQNLLEVMTGHVAEVRKSGCSVC